MTHKTPEELAREFNFEPGIHGTRRVLEMATELGVPIYNGKIDRALFLGAAHERGDLKQHPVIEIH